MSKSNVTPTKAAKAISTIQQFAKAVGSQQGADPIPPSQYLYFLDPNQPGLQRLLAWVRSKTIRFRPQKDGSDGRSPFCVNERGKALSLSDMAHELGWKLPNASREWAAAEKLGLVKRAGKRLMLVGQVPSIKRGKGRRKVICTDNLPQSLLREIKRWPKPRQDAFYEVWEPAVKLGQALQAVQIAKARMVATEVHDTILTSFGLERKHLHPPKSPQVIEIPQPLRRFVQITCDGAVQITSGVVRTDNKIDPVQITPSLLPSEKIQRGDEQSSSSVATTELATALQIDDDAASRLWTECRTANPEITAREIVTLAAIKQHQLKGKERNRVGLLLAAVPKMATGATWEKARGLVAEQLRYEAATRAELARLGISEHLPEGPTGSE